MDHDQIKQMFAEQVLHVEHVAGDSSLRLVRFNLNTGTDNGTICIWTQINSNEEMIIEMISHFTHNPNAASVEEHFEDHGFDDEDE